MKTLNIKFPDGSQRTIAPVPRASLGHFSTLLIELQSIWIEEEFSTGDAIARDDAWDLMTRLWAMLPCVDAPGMMPQSALELLSSDYQQLGELFFGDAEKAYQGTLATFDLRSFVGCKLWELHEVNPRKKLLAADECRQERNQAKPSQPPMSPSKQVATSKPIPSPTSLTDSVKSRSRSTKPSTLTPSTP